MATHRLTRSGLSGLRVLESLVLVVALLYLGKPILVPLALAVLITFVLTPIVILLQHGGLKRVPAVLVVGCCTFLVLAGIGWGVGSQLRRLVHDLPAHTQEIKQKVDSLRASNENAFGQLIRMIQEVTSGEEAFAGVPTEKKTIEPGADRPVIIADTTRTSTMERFIAMVGPVLEPLAMTGLVIILVVFMLVKREDLRNRVISLLGHGHLTGTTRVFVDAAERVSKFLLNQLLVNAGYGIVFGVGLALLGVPYAFLWAFLTALLRFVPYIGSWIAVAFPVLLSFAMTPGWTQPVLVLVFFVCLDLVTANVIEPLLFGHSTGVAPIALLIAAAFWTWLWGSIGLVLSTPLTVCLVAIGQHIPRFKFLALLLGDQPALSPHASYYQRLVAHDPEEAKEVVHRFMKEFGAEKVFDELFLPALVLARRDRKLGGLTAEEEGYVYQTTREILDQLAKTSDGEAKSEKAAETAKSEAAAQEPEDAECDRAALPLVLACPAHHEAEELSLVMLGHLLKAVPCRLEPVSTKVLPMDIEERVEQDRPALVFIAILAPGGLVQARYLCKRLTAHCPKLPVVVGCWGGGRNFDKALVRFRAAGASYITTSLLQARSQIQTMLAAAKSAPVNKSLQAAGAR